MIKPIFAMLKANYKTQPTQIHKCSMHFPNTCAIRMSEALAMTDAKLLDVFKNSNKNKCPHGYIRGAQDLAAILALPSVWGIRNYGWSSQPGGNPPANVIGKRGVVCYMNIPGFGGQGHIDLWDNNVPVGDSYWDAGTVWMWAFI
jgi:hypothetical protein